MRTRECNAATRTGRMAKAEAFHTSAVLTSEDENLRDAAVTLYVHAGIAAADVICCARLGVHALGEDHAEAVALLGRAERGRATALKTLLALKTKASYGADKVSATELKRAQRAADQLIETARLV